MRRRADSGSHDRGADRRRELRQELELARAGAASTLPAVMPACPGLRHDRRVSAGRADRRRYLRPALAAQGLLVVLGDATGHGIAPALSVTKMHAMLRMALRLGADLERPSGRSTINSPRPCPKGASSPPSSACSTRAATVCTTSAPGRGRCCTGGRPMAHSTRCRRPAFRSGPCAARAAAWRPRLKRATCPPRLRRVSRAGRCRVIGETAAGSAGSAVRSSWLAWRPAAATLAPAAVAVTSRCELHSSAHAPSEAAPRPAPEGAALAVTSALASRRQQGSRSAAGRRCRR